MKYFLNGFQFVIISEQVYVKYERNKPSQRAITVRLQNGQEITSLASCVGGKIRQENKLKKIENNVLSFGRLV